MARVAEYEGQRFELVSFAHDFNTGRELVILKLYWRDSSELLRQRATYGAAANLVISSEDFREMFVWVDV